MLHAQVVGLAAAAGLPSPPLMDGAGLPVYVRIPLPTPELPNQAAYRFERLPNSVAREKWEMGLRALQAAARAWQDGQTDNKPDKRQEKSSRVPRNKDVCKLINEASRKKNRDRPLIDIAREITDSNEKLAQSIARQARRYKHLLPRSGK